MTAGLSGFLNIIAGLAPLFYALLLMSVTAGLAGLVILLIRRILDQKLSPFWKYLMWFIVLLALVIPFRPQSDLALVDTDAIARQIPYSGSIAVSSPQASEMPDSVASDIPASVNDPSGQAAPTVRTWIFDIAIPAVWAGGVLCLTLFILIGGLRLRRRIRSALTPAETAPYDELLETCKVQIGLHTPGTASTQNRAGFPALLDAVRAGVPALLDALRARILSPVTVVVQDQVGFPALLGVFRPRILFPLYVRELDGACLENIMLHELSHMKRCDHLVNGLMLILKILYWFNPVVWLICRFIKQDMEVANDAAVLRHMDGAAQKNYGLSLVEVLARGNAPALMPRLLCMADNVKNTERRIGMIRLNAVFKRRKALIAVVALLIILAVGALFLTQRGDTPVPPPVNEDTTSSDVNTLYGIPDEEVEALFKSKIPYVGENNGVGYIIGAFRTPSRLVYSGFELSTGEEPYGVTLNYETDTVGYDYYRDAAADVGRGALSYQAVLMLALIDNADFVRFDLHYIDAPDEAPLSIEYSKSWAETQWGDLSEATANIGAFRAFVDELNEKYIFLPKARSDTSLFFTDPNPEQPAWPIPGLGDNHSVQVAPDAAAPPAPRQMFPLEKARKEVAYKLGAADGDGSDDKSYNLALLDRFIANMKSGTPDEVNVIYYVQDTKGAVSIKDWYYLTFDGATAKLYGYYELDDGTFSYDVSGVDDGWTVERKEIEGGINYRIRFGDGDADTMHFFWAENPTGGAGATTIPTDRRLEQAKADGYVVFENSSITSGKSVWNRFAAQCKRGKPASVRLAFYYTLEKRTPQISEANDQYPFLSIQKLNYDGKVYTLSYKDEGKDYQFTYSYMKHYKGVPNSPDAAFSSYDRYVLVNDDTVTWDQIERGMYSSTSDQWIDNHEVYTDLIP